LGVGSGRDVVVARGTVEQVERALSTTLGVWQHAQQTDVKRIRTLEWTLPDEVAEHVELVSGLMEFWLPPRGSKRAPAAKLPGNSVKAGYVIPDTVRRLYNMPKDAYRDVSKLSSLCLAEFQDDASFDNADLRYFDQQMGEAQSHVDHIVGPYQPGQPDGESLLDVEFGSTLALNGTYWFWTVQGWMYEFSTDLFKTKNGPHVVSMSWGWGEEHQCDITTCPGTSRQYVDRVNTEFNKIVATGVTLLAASGDQGAPGDTHGDSCDGLGTIFPGASPWVLSVGATMLDDKAKPVPFPPHYKKPPVCQQFACSEVVDEIACSIPEALITSGGGFSDYVLRPAWQDAAVLAYLNDTKIKFPAQHKWHRANRGFPDVAANGHALLISDQQSLEQVDGTSASSPIVASMIALINGYRLNSKKKTVGFVNPAIYKAWEKDPSTFKAIGGPGNGASESCSDPNNGFETNPKGWSAVTGLGTINFPKLLAYLGALP